MRVAFIACEYNPFHNGHKYHIEKTKEAGVDAVVCIMSGNFVQRGDIAVAEKHLRAKAALLSGADLVIELPLKYAVSTASYFAKGFVEAAKATGLQGSISFGSGSDVSELKQIKDILFSENCQSYANQKISAGVSFPLAKTQYIKENYPDIDINALSDSNNILAFEYLNAADTIFPEAGILAIQRKGTEHDSLNTDGIFASASYIRGQINNGAAIDSVKEFLPDTVFDLYKDALNNKFFPTDRNKFNSIAMSRIVDLEADFIRKINNVNGGMENRIIDAIKKSDSIDSVYEIVKSKHYTHSRIRQIILHMVLGIKKTDLDSGISYLRVLGFNNKGREVLLRINSKTSLPVVTNLSQLDKNNEIIKRDSDLDYLAGRLLNFCLPEIHISNPEYEIPPIYIAD